MSAPLADLDRRGWQKFPADPEVAGWARAVPPHAKAAIADPANSHWLRCGGSWFAGVNVLPNTSDGSIGNTGPLRGRAVDALGAMMGQVPEWDAGQISVVYPGYPRQENESDTAFGYRMRRDAAHVDGIVRIGPEDRRYIREPHGFVLGIPLNDCDDRASPLVIWERSQVIIRRALRDALGDAPPEEWSEIDITDAYRAARRRCFAQCPRVIVHASPGEAYVIHRHALHGISPWSDGAKAGPEGRVIAYFRPVMTSIEEWLAG